MSSKEIRDWAGNDRELGTVLRDHYDLLLPAIVAKFEFNHPSILGSLESKGGLIDNMCKEAGLFFVVEHRKGAEADRMSVYIDELAKSLATVIAPLLYFSAKPGSEKHLGGLFVASFTRYLNIRVSGYIYATQETDRKYGKPQTGNG